MKKRFKLVLVLMLGWIALPAQDSLDTLLRIVTENNRDLQAAMKRYETDVLSFRVGNAPPNPQVEYGRLWSDPGSLSDQVDFAVSQTFDFPTAYTSQSRLRRVSTEQAELQLLTVKQEVMAETRKKWVVAVYLNKKLELLRQRLLSSELVYQGFERKLETGEANQLERNQAFLKMTMLRNDYNQALTVLENNRNEIRNFAGGVEFTVTDTLLPEPGELILDSLLDAYGAGPANRWFMGEVERWEQQKLVIFNKKLPRLTASYYSESVLGQDLRGVKARLTIPLWGDAHAVNRAKAAINFAETDAWRYWAGEQTRITNLHSRWSTLKMQVEDLVEAVLEADNETLLNRALQTGEMSLTQYFYESDFYFQSRLLIIDSWRDMLLLEAELMKVYY